MREKLRERERERVTMIQRPKDVALPYYHECWLDLKLLEQNPKKSQIAIERERFHTNPNF